MQDSDCPFELAYEGEALKENTMEVRDLAPALLAFGELFTRANQILNGENTSVSLKVRATQPGSFELLLILAQVFYTTTQFLSGGFVTSAANLVSLMVGIPKVGDNLFSLFKKLKGQKPTEVNEQPSGVTLKVGNIEVLVPSEVFKLYSDNDVKKLSQAVVEPLFRTGIDMMIIKQGEKRLESVNKQDATSFTVTDIPNGDGTENIIPMLALRLVSPTFDLKRTKWRLDDGSGVKWYGIEDENFLREVREHRRRFGMGDYLICRVRTVQRITESGLEMERTILKVLDQRIGGEQLTFGSTNEIQ